MQQLKSLPIYFGMPTSDVRQLSDTSHLQVILSGDPANDSSMLLETLKLEMTGFPDRLIPSRFRSLLPSKLMKTPRLLAEYDLSVGIPFMDVSPELEMWMPSHVFVDRLDRSRRSGRPLHPLTIV